MDDNYKQDSIPNDRQGVSYSTLQSANSDSPTTISSLPLLISLIMSIIAMVETIVLTIVVINAFMTDNYDYIDIEETVEDVPTAYIFDSNDDITAFSVTCTSPDNSKLVFNLNNEYLKFNQSSSLVGSGSYNIVRSSAVTLEDENGNAKSVYYDGANIIDGTTFYECEEDS